MSEIERKELLRNPEDLFQKYGSTMQRLGEAEHEIVLLRHQLESTNVSRPRDDRILSMERTIDEQDSAISYMRAQLVAIQAQLQRSEEMRREATQNMPSRLRRQRPWWRFWRYWRLW